MRRAASLVFVSVSLLACGGSSSETPFPQSVADMTSDPVLRRPRPTTSATPMTPGRRRSPQPTGEP